MAKKWTGVWTVSWLDREGKSALYSARMGQEEAQDVVSRLKSAEEHRLVAQWDVRLTEEAAAEDLIVDIARLWRRPAS